MRRASPLLSINNTDAPLAVIDSTGAYRYYTEDRIGSIRADTGPAGGVRDRGGYMRLPVSL